MNDFALLLQMSIQVVDKGPLSLHAHRLNDLRETMLCCRDCYGALRYLRLSQSLRTDGKTRLKVKARIPPPDP
ncbi:hypothetical protein O9992_09015 [Vibrio lentus]|nr:hypothetical protein [Vibrio lentus]